jgi:hypothetical protein
MLNVDRASDATPSELLFSYNHGKNKLLVGDDSDIGRMYVKTNILS